MESLIYNTLTTGIVHSLKRRRCLPIVIEAATTTTASSSSCYQFLSNAATVAIAADSRDYKCAVGYYVSHFLVHESKAKEGQKLVQTLRIDVLITVHWWSHFKTKAGSAPS
ncbi:conserved hypothetical protein [Ricinus communis]|uniref:Uncharacterized protein n=1 Tax=Ricinus communis TaxID=3988 RepID=B9T1Q2_RICCO|nr:conserved hypothetical protein [Ricinus communis]